jgi:predicted amino acid dehydrogenase
MSSKLTPCGFQVTDDIVCNQLQKGEISACDNTIEIRSPGGVVFGKDWIIPLTPSEILQNQDRTIDMTIEACELAQSWGADMIGLGLLLGKIGRRGVDVSRRINVPVTNGDSYLIYNSVQVLETILNNLNLDLSKEVVAIFGFPSLISQLLAEYFISVGVRITLITKSTPFINRVLKKITRQGNSVPELVPSISEASKESRFFFTAGSENQLALAHDFVAPAIVIDVSFPKNVPKPADHVFAIDSGIVNVPKAFLNMSGYYPDKALTCLSELMMLSLEGHCEDFSLGRNISLQKIKQIGNWAIKYGFNSDQLFSYGQPIDKEDLYEFYDRNF